MTSFYCRRSHFLSVVSLFWVCAVPFASVVGDLQKYPGSLASLLTEWRSVCCLHHIGTQGEEALCNSAGRHLYVTSFLLESSCQSDPSVIFKGCFPCHPQAVCHLMKDQDPSSMPFPYVLWSLCSGPRARAQVQSLTTVFPVVSTTFHYKGKCCCHYLKEKQCSPQVHSIMKATSAWLKLTKGLVWGHVLSLRWLWSLFFKW